MCRLYGKVGGNVANQGCGTGRPLGPVTSQYIFLFFSYVCHKSRLSHPIASRLIPHDLFTSIFREKYRIIKRLFVIILTFMGPCISNIFSSITNKMLRYTSYLFLWNAVHVSGGSCAYHQELKNCIYRIGYFVKPFLLPATLSCISSTTVTGSRKSLTKYPMLYVQFLAPDDRRRNRLKHVEHFTELNNLCNIVSSWLYLKIFFFFNFLSVRSKCSSITLHLRISVFE